MDNRAKIDTAAQSVTASMPTRSRRGLGGWTHLLTSWLRDPSWLTVRRVTLYSSVLLFGCLAAAIGRLFHSQHMIFPGGANIGGDFVNLYAASLAALGGVPASVYDIYRQHLREVALTGGTDTGVVGFFYPPMYLLIVLPLSMLPFIASWVAFETLTLAGYLAVVRRIAPLTLGLWLAIAFPAVIINFMCGQNGFLTTALIGGGLLVLDRRPLLAGFLFGLMAYKPQFAILIPFALLVACRWRALIATAVSAMLFALASLAVFGATTWRAFIGSIAFTQKIALERGVFSTLQSTFGGIRMWGGSVEIAYALQAVVAIYAASAVVWIWRSRRPFALKAAALAAGSLMVSPYVLRYDLVLLALPIAWLAMEAFEDGFLPYEKIVLAVAWILPLISLPVSKNAKIPIAPIVIIALMTAILRRASHRETATHQLPAFT